MLSIGNIEVSDGAFSPTVPGARYLGSAFVALIIPIARSMGEGGDITEKFVMRVVQIGSAALYIVAALSVLDRFLFRSAGQTAA